MASKRAQVETLTGLEKSTQEAPSPTLAAVAFERVEARGLVKVFGATRALAGVDLTFETGAVTVVEGPNGSGKSTLLAILAQLTRPSRGEVRYGTLAPGSTALRRHIGVLGHAAMVYPDLTGRENLQLYARLYGLGAGTDRIAALIDRFELRRFVDRTPRTWSRGQLQRVALARALMHEPTLLLLDEPSTGLDVHAVERLVGAVDVERVRGAIVVLVTHDTVLAERIADRRVRLERGRVASDAMARREPYRTPAEGAS